LYDWALEQFFIIYLSFNTLSYQICNNQTRNLVTAKKSYVSTTHTVTTVHFHKEGFTGSIWDTGGGGCCREHKL